MRNRPAGISAMIRAFDTYRLDRTLLEACNFPAYIGYGDLSDDYQLVKAQVLARLFGDIQVRRYRVVFNDAAPPEIYTSEHAAELVDLWQRGEKALAAQLPRQ